MFGLRLSVFAGQDPRDDFILLFTLSPETNDYLTELV
jgi:hypothetical protein